MPSRPIAPVTGIEPFGASCAFGVLASVLSTVVPFFLGMTVALAVTATVAWNGTPGTVDFYAKGVSTSLSYLLPVVVSGVLSTHEVSVGSGISVSRLLEKPVEEQPAGARGASVEAEGELVEVVVEVLGTDCALMGSQQPPLEE